LCVCHLAPWLAPAHTVFTLLGPCSA